MEYHQKKTWRKNSHVISMDPNIIPLESLKAAFASDQLYWAKPFELGSMTVMVDNSLCWALYPEASFDDQSDKPKELIGFARGVTDFTTFVYFTDVYVLPEHQGKGLGMFLIDCVNEVMRSMPYLRRSMLLTQGARAVDAYKKNLEMRELTDKLTILEWKGPGNAI